jgi:hypothetical protein
MFWSVIFGTSDNYLIVGNAGEHPFVQIPEFSFCNSDGSTSDYEVEPALPLKAIKDLAKKKSLEYIFNQRH